MVVGTVIHLVGDNNLSVNDMDGWVVGSNTYFAVFTLSPSWRLVAALAAAAVLAFTITAEQRTTATGTNYHTPLLLLCCCCGNEGQTNPKLEIPPILNRVGKSTSRYHQSKICNKYGRCCLIYLRRNKYNTYTLPTVPTYTHLYVRSFSSSCPPWILKMTLY